MKSYMHLTTIVENREQMKQKDIIVVVDVINTSDNIMALNVYYASRR